MQDSLYPAAAAETGSSRLVTAEPTFHARAVPAFPFVTLRAAVRPQ